MSEGDAKFWAHRETYDSIRDGQFLTLDEQIEELAPYLPDWDRTLDGLGKEATRRDWSLRVEWSNYFDVMAIACLEDWNDAEWDEGKDRYNLKHTWSNKWSKDNPFYAAIRCFRAALNVPEYPQRPWENTPPTNAT